jgi:acetyl esterase/lipase
MQSNRSLLNRKEMKKHFWLLLIVCSFLPALGQTAATTNATNQYKTEVNILYRNDKREKLNDYALKNCRLDIVYPVNNEGFATVVWFHGGGLTGGGRDIPQPLRNKGLAIVSVGYRLSPNVKCPAYIEDAAAAVAWVFRNIDRYGGATNKIYISGHSAGGYLALMVGLDKHWLAKYNVDADKIAGLVPFSGQCITHYTIRNEQGISSTQPIIDQYAPLYHVRSNAPPLVLITGDREAEMIGRYEENAYMWRMMRVVGHQQTTLTEIKGFDHGGMWNPACDVLLKWLKDKTAIHAQTQ